MAFPNLSEIVTTTLRNRTGELADNMSRNNALLARLSRRGKIKTFAELPVEVKNANSHRGRAAQAMVALMRERWLAG